MGSGPLDKGDVADADVRLLVARPRGGELRLPLHEGRQIQPHQLRNCVGKGRQHRCLGTCLHFLANL
jgi:hypothetical protein